MALDELARGAMPLTPPGLQIIVGQSTTVVRDAVERALIEAHPPIAFEPVYENPGRLLVPSDSLLAWAAARGVQLRVKLSAVVAEPPVGIVPRRRGSQRKMAFATEATTGGRRPRFSLQQKAEEEGKERT